LADIERWLRLFGHSDPGRFPGCSVQRDNEIGSTTLFRKPRLRLASRLLSATRFPDCNVLRSHSGILKPLLANGRSLHQHVIPWSELRSGSFVLRESWAPYSRL